MTDFNKPSRDHRLQNVRLQDNLIQLMRKTRKNMTDIHRQTGLPITTIQRVCKDTNANPTLASLIPIADFFSVSIAQLIGEEPLPDAGSVHRHWRNIPLIEWSTAQFWPHIPFNNQPQNFIATELKISNHSYALIIHDDHHEGFHRGSQLIVDPSLTSKHRDYVISQKKESSSASLKQVLLHEGDMYLKPTNPEFKTTLMDDNYKILGVVVQVRMDLK